jgi:hypothetical protein
MSIRPARLSLVLLAALATLAGLLVVAGAATARPAAGTHAPMRPGPAHPVPMRQLAYATSTNWAGWDNVGSTYTTVSASWVQPAVTCGSRETSYSSFWVGLDGDGSNSVEQTGSEADCNRGTPVYYSWYEFYPAYPVNYSSTVRPGDHFTAKVTYTGSGSYTLVLSDTTRGWSHTKTGSAPSAQNASAEVIAEAPSSNTGVLPLANFGSVKFTGATVNGSPLGTVPTPQKITMATRSYTKAAVSNLTNNNTFTVTWKHH